MERATIEEVRSKMQIGDEVRYIPSVSTEKAYVIGTIQYKTQFHFGVSPNDGNKILTSFTYQDILMNESKIKLSNYL